MTILVTGGAGFVGSTLVHALCARGDTVPVLDDLSTGPASNRDCTSAELVVCSFLDASRLRACTADVSRTRPRRQHLGKEFATLVRVLADRCQGADLALWRVDG